MDRSSLEHVILEEIKEWNDASLDLFDALGKDQRAWPAQRLMNGCDRCILYESLIGEVGCRELDCRAGDRFSDTWTRTGQIGRLFLGGERI